MKLIIAKPSPFARKVRVSMLEKALPFETVVENPWLPQTTVCNANPLCKVPALVLDDGMVLHDSKVIFEYLETLGAAPHLLPGAYGARIPHKQIEAIADGICDAIVLISLEGTRPEPMRSADWLARQHDKVVAGVAELSRLLGEQEWFTPFGFGLADIATVCALEYIEFRYPQYDWRAAAPNLERLLVQVAQRQSFAMTKPQGQVLPELR
jgi:glutathione S-transferase